MKSFYKESLEYHAMEPAGKIDVQSSKEVSTEYALSLAYSPGVAAPCEEIAKDPSKVFDYTSKGNLVGVVTNGTAVLGLGSIGALAGKPVMEGKGVLFKRFANINVFDIEIDTENVEEFITTVKNLEPTFGGINLEDIGAPACFEIEERLKKEMNIPVFHDDQHGTAIISGAALLNACILAEKDLSKIKVVFNGAGAAAMSCAKLFIDLGVTPENLYMCDSKGVITTDRDNLKGFKKDFARTTSDKTLKDILKGADVFCGLSVGNVVNEDMIMSMNERPIVFAMANPTPEIDPNLVKKIRPEAIVATGRSDFPNQVNNVLGFPYIFRGALDVQATSINEAMKLAAVKALAELTRESVPEEVSSAYSGQDFTFGPDYIIPKPFDTRVLLTVAPAVAKAAMETGVARKPIEDFNAYVEKLESYLGVEKSFIRPLINKVKSHNNGKKPQIVFPEGFNHKVLKAAQEIIMEGFAEPVLIGDAEKIQENAEKLELKLLKDVKVINPLTSEHQANFVEELYKLRARKGVLYTEAKTIMKDPFYFASMMVRQGLVDGMVSGATQSYARSVKPLLEVIDTYQNKVAAGVNIVLTKNKTYFLADTTMLVDPSAEEIAQTAIEVSQLAKSYGVDPQIAMLSFTSFTGKSGTPAKMKKAAEIVQKIQPELIVEGEMQADAAVNPEILQRLFPFSNLTSGANVLMFPNLDSSNIAYKLIQQLSDAEVVGPILLGLNKPCNIVQRTGGVKDIVNAAVLTALDIHEKTYATPKFI